MGEILVPQVVGDIAKDRGKIWKTLGVVLAFSALTVCLRWPLFFSSLIPARGDAFISFFAFKGLAASEIQQGRFPLWNPHIFCGQPLFADPQVAVLSPWSWLFCFFDMVPAYIGYIFLRHVVAATLMFLFLRGHHLNRMGAFLGGLVFSFSSTVSRQIWWVDAMSPYIWLPLLLWLCDRLITRKKKFWTFLWLALVCTFLNLSGHPQNAYYTYLITALYFIARSVIEINIGRGWWKNLVASGALLPLALFLSVGLASVQVLPMLEFTRETRYEDGFSLEDAAHPSVEATSLPRTFLGGVLADTEPIGGTAYLGILSLFLLPIGLFRGRSLGIIAMILGSLALLVSLGLQTPVFEFLYEHLPLFRDMHAPDRILPLVVFFGSVLVAIAASHLLGEKTPRRRETGPTRPAHRFLLVGLVLLTLIGTLIGASNLINGMPFENRNLLALGPPALLLLALLFSKILGKKTLFALAVVLLFVDLSHFNASRFAATLKAPDSLVNIPETVQFLREDPGPHRASFFTNGYRPDKRTAFPPDIERELISGIYPNSSMLFGTRDGQGAYTLKSRELHEFAKAMVKDIRGGRWVLDRLTLLGNPFSPLYDLVGTKYILSAEENPLPRIEPLQREGEQFLIPSLTRNPTQLAVEFSLPESQIHNPSPWIVTLHGSNGEEIAESVLPKFIPLPRFSSFARLTGKHPRITWEPDIEETWTDDFETRWTGMKTESGPVQKTPDGLLLNGSNDLFYQSEWQPFQGAIAIHYRSTSISHDSGAVQVEIATRSNEEIGRTYNFVHADEGFSAIRVNGRAKTGTRAFQTQQNETLGLRAEWVGDQLTLNLGEKRILRYRDTSLVPPEEIQIRIGSRGGPVRLGKITVSRPSKDSPSHLVRLPVQVPPSFELKSISVRDEDGVFQVPVSVYALDESKFEEAFRRDTISIFRNQEALPRAFLVGGHRVLDHEARLAALGDPGFDPRSTVILSKSCDALSAIPKVDAALGEGTVEFIEDLPNQITLRVDAKKPGLLFLADSYFTGWEAKVNDGPVEILAANHAFRAVVAPKGSYDVVFRYRPRSLRDGAIVSLASLTLWIALGVGWIVRRRKALVPDS